MPLSTHEEWQTPVLPSTNPMLLPADCYYRHTPMIPNSIGHYQRASVGGMTCVNIHQTSNPASLLTTTGSKHTKSLEKKPSQI